jgi:beta-galactosidase
MKKGKPFFVMESTPSNLNWVEYYRLKRPGVHQLEMTLPMGHGADGTLYFQWRKGMGGFEKFHGAVVDHVGHENTRVFKEVVNISDIQKKIEPVLGTTVETKTAVIHDWDSCWAIELSCGPTNDHKKGLETIQSHYRALYHLSVPMDVIESEGDFAPYKLIVAPILYMLKPGVAARLKQFVENGGTLICTYLSGYVNETNLCFTGGWPGDGLQKLFGIWNEELDGFAPTDKQSVVSSAKNGLGLNGEFDVMEFAERIHLQGAAALATFGHDFYAGEPAVTVNHFGKGKAYYIAARTGDDFLLEFYRKVVESEKVQTALPLGNPVGVHGSIRTDGEKRFLFVYNFGSSDAQVDLGGGTFRDMLNGKEIRGTQIIPKHGSTVLEMI